MKTYRVLSLQQVIDALRTLPGDPLVRGLSSFTHSYRGYYERAAVEKVDWPTRASVLADDLQKEVGTSMTGYKGGEYFVQGDLPLHVADYGNTGPAIAGFEPVDNETGVYEPVLIEEAWF